MPDTHTSLGAGGPEFKSRRSDQQNPGTSFNSRFPEIPLGKRLGSKQLRETMADENEHLAMLVATRSRMITRASRGSERANRKVQARSH